MADISQKDLAVAADKLAEQFEGLFARREKLKNAAAQALKLAEASRRIEPAAYDVTGLNAHGFTLSKICPSGQPPRTLLGYTPASSVEALVATDGIGKAAAVDRSGEVVAVPFNENGGGEPEGFGAADRPADLMLRAFGLPTRPPSITVKEMMTGMWTHFTVEKILGSVGAEPPGWSEIAMQHPLFAWYVHNRNEPPEYATPQEFASAINFLLAGLSWEHMRETVAEQRSQLPALLRERVGVTPEEVGWMDEGVFSRFMDSGINPDKTMTAEQLEKISQIPLGEDVCMSVESAHELLGSETPWYLKR